MISIEKLEMLDRKVKEAVALIADLKEANTRLSEENTLLMERIDELEKESRTIRDDQELIEETIQEAIVQLEKVHGTGKAPVAKKGAAVPPVPVREESVKITPEEVLADDEEDSGEVTPAEVAARDSDDEEFPGYAYQPPEEKVSAAAIYRDEEESEEELAEEEDFFSEKEGEGEPRAKGDELEIF